MDLARYPTRDLLRSIGGILVAGGAIALEIRKSSSWGLDGRMLVSLIPAVVLYVWALDLMKGVKHASPGDPEPWQTVLAVLAVFLNSIWLTLFCRWIGLHGSLVLIGALGLSSLSAWYAAWRANIRFAALLGALDVVVAWLALWNKILGYPSGDTDRWLLMIVGVLLAAVAYGLARLGRREASEVVTAAGVATVLASAAGVFLDLLGFGLNRVVRELGATHAVGAFNVRQHFFWDLVLLLIAVALITYGARARVRGPGYIGGAGLFIFVFSVGLQLSSRISGGSPSRSVLGWPVALLLIGAAALVLSLVAPRFARKQGAPSSSAAGPPAPPSS